jgi:hypothetical protein
MMWLHTLAAGASAPVLPTVSVSATGQSTDTADGPTYAGFTIRSTGLLYRATNISGAAINASFVESWLDSGTSAQVWVERDINSGSLNIDDIGASRVSCTTSPGLYVFDSDNGAPSVDANVTVRFYDAATNGNLLETATWALSANYTIA